MHPLESVYPGARIEAPTGEVTLAVDAYDLETADYAPDDETMLVLHRLTPRTSAPKSERPL